MPLLDSEAIILRSTPHGEADKLVSFLSRPWGRLQGIAPWARKSRRRFGATLELLTHCRLWFFERPSRSLVRLAQSELIASYWDAGGDYTRSLALGQVAELLEVLLPEREPSERMFRLTLATLQALKQGTLPWLPLTYFQLWAVRLAGLLPALDRCTRCGQPLAPGEPVRVDARGPQLLCRRCVARGLGILAARERSRALVMLSSPLARLVNDPELQEPSPGLERFLLDAVEHHAERKLVTRRLLHENA